MADLAVGTGHYSDIEESEYRAFLRSKRSNAKPCGFEPKGAISEKLFAFQADLVRWALQRGKAAIFADCGLGKSPVQLEWAKHVSEHTGMPILILAPLAVARQTQSEGEKFGVPVTVCRDQGDIRPGVNVTNYDRLHLFSPEGFGGIVLDESSVLKGFSSRTRADLIRFAQGIGYRLCCTATPSPNDLVELANHSEFLDILSRKEMIALFFRQDNEAINFRLKGHAKEPFYRWLASWAAAVRKPSDLGYEDGAFLLPELRNHQVTVDSPATPGRLFAEDAIGLTATREARRASLDARVKAAAALVNADDRPWLVWCDLNDESSALAKAIPGAVEVRGSDPTSFKEDALMGFSEGRHRVLVTKPIIAGWGLNWQHCDSMVFVGLSHSFEQYYQAVRRCWRFGQLNPVDAYVVVGDAEGSVVTNIDRKAKQAAEMMDSIVRHTANFSLGRASREEMSYVPDLPIHIPSWLTPVSI